MVIYIFLLNFFASGAPLEFVDSVPMEATESTISNPNNTDQMIFNGQPITFGNRKPTKPSPFTGQTQVHSGQAIGHQGLCPGMTSMECNVVKLTNKLRQSQRPPLPPLKVSLKCNKAAKLSSTQMKNTRHMSHSWFKQNAGQWGLVRENVAMGQMSGKEVYDSWRTSPGHRKNMLSRDIQFVGVSLVRGQGRGRVPGYYWTQCFH